MPEKIKVLISTDILGMFGKIRTLEKIYGNQLKSLEMISWTPTLDQQIQEANESDYEVIRLHGRLYSPIYPETEAYSLILYTGNFLLKPTPELLKEYSQKYDILLHTPVFDDKGITNIAEKYKDTIRQLWLENHGFGELGVERAIHVVNLLRLKGVNTGLCVDLAHFIGKDYLHSSEFAERWNLLLKFLSKQVFNFKDEFGVPIPLSMHFPVGTDLGDSLPILDLLTEKMLKEMVSIVQDSRISLITIENQQKGKQNYFHINNKMIDKISERNTKIIEKLGEAGLIT